MPRITIFGSSQSKEGVPEYRLGVELGRELAQAGFTLCNGGYGGMMEATARGAKEAGGKTIGVTTEEFGGKANRWIDEEIRTRKWRERLFKLVELGDGYCIFDGGTGTLVELFVVWEMTNKTFHSKPVVVLGRKLGRLVTELCKWPEVMTNPNLSIVSSASEAVKVLNLR